MLQVGCIKVSDVNRTFYVVSSEEDGILAAFEVKADEFVRAGVEIESKPVRWTQLSPTEIEMIKAGNTDFVRQ